MRQLLLAAAIAVAVPTNVLGQTPPIPGTLPSGMGRITGTVHSAEGRPLPTVAVTVRSAADSAIVTGVMSDAAGRFRVEGLMPGRYLLRVSVIGYRPRSSEPILISPDRPVHDLGIITLEVSAVALDAVEVSAERQAVVVEADRTTYSVRSMPVAATGTASDVLRAVPELEVDVDDNVRMRGNQPVAIHINGRPAPLRGEQLVNFLRQLPGNRIDKVEVLPNPSAKHDPEGMGGIVNIVLREDLDLGLSGSVTANASTRNRQAANTRLNFQRGKVTLFTGAGLNRFANEFGNYDLRRNLRANPITTIEQNSLADNRSRGWNLDWTAEYRAGRQATLWSNAWLFSSTSDMLSNTAYGIFDDANAVLERYDRRNDGQQDWGNYNVGVGFKQIFQRQKEELTIDGRWASGINDSRSVQLKLMRSAAGEPLDVPPEHTLQEIDAGNATLTGQADYFRPLGRGRIDVGYRVSRRTQDSDNSVHTFVDTTAVPPGAGVHAGFDYEELLNSAYSTVSRPFGRFSVQLGLRAEHTATRFDSHVQDATFERDYVSLFPTASLSYAPRQGRTARLLYSRRINRPSTWHLDPFVPTTDPLNVNVGNPDLRPSYTNSFSLELSTTSRRGTLRLAPYYRETSDIWERIRTVDEQGVATNRWENASSSKAYGSNLTLSLAPTGRLSGSSTFNLYRDTRDGTNLSGAYRRSAVLWSLSGNLGFKATETLTAQVFANHFPTQSILQGRASGYTFSSVSLRQQVFNRRGSVSLNMMDPLNLMKWNSSSADATYQQRSRSTNRMRSATLGVTYNFGKPPQQQSRRSMQEEEGETIRVR